MRPHASAEGRTSPLSRSAGPWAAHLAGVIGGPLAMFEVVLGAVVLRGERGEGPDAGADPVCAVAFALESDGIDERRPSASIGDERPLRARRGERRRCGGHACECERVRAVGWENPSCPAGSVRVRREYPSGRSEVARWLASRARRERARAVGDRHRRGCYVSACRPGPTVRIGPAPRRTLVGRSQLMVTPSGVACSCRSDPQ